MNRAHVSFVREASLWKKTTNTSADAFFSWTFSGLCLRGGGEQPIHHRLERGAFALDATGDPGIGPQGKMRFADSLSCTVCLPSKHETSQEADFPLETGGSYFLGLDHFSGDQAVGFVVWRIHSGVVSLLGFGSLVLGGPVPSKSG